MMSEAGDHSSVRFSDKIKLRTGRAGENHREARLGREEDEKGWNSFTVFLSLGVVI